MTSIVTNLQTATIATFVDLQSIAGLGIINYGASVGKSLVSPIVDGGMIGMFLAACVDGTHDLVKWYFLKASAGMPVGTSGTTTAG